MLTLPARRNRIPASVAGTILAVLVVATGAVPPAGAQALTVADIGAPPAPGMASFGAVTTVSSRGWDVNGASDQFTFVYRSLTGDATLVTRVDSLQNVDPWAQTGLMIRESLAANANHATVLASAGNGVVFRFRKSAKSGTSQAKVAAGTAPTWLRLVRSGTTVTASRSDDGITWSTVATAKLQFAQTVLVGVAVASHNTAANTTAVLSNVAVSAPVSNAAPAVTLTSPVSSTVLAPASIALAATASDSDGTVAGVDFYAGTTLLGTDTTSPYSWSWTNVPAGTYAVKAVARDNAGATASSATVTVVVNAPPTVSLAAPTATTTAVAPATLALSATAADSDGTIAKVDFYADTTLLGTDTSSPYVWTWSNVPAGTYALRAVATDNRGASTTSLSRTVTVSANTAPTVSLLTPSQGDVFAAPASVNLTAAAADADGTIASVDFYAGTTLLGSATSSPYSVSWPNVPAGSYSITAMARDNRGAVTVSSTRDITVTASGTPSTALFTPASDNDVVVRYVLDIFPAGSDPAVAAPLASQDLGKPAVVNNQCSADIRGTIAGLQAGTYIASVYAIGPDGTFRSDPSAPFTK